MALVLGLTACPRTASEPVEPEPEPEPATLPTFPPPEADLTPLDLSPGPLPEGVVAAVDGEPIYAEELERLVQAAPSEDDPQARRQAALVRLVERDLLLAKADQMDIQASEDEVQHALDEVAASNEMTLEQLEQEVSATGWTWEGYREELVAQIVEMKVLTINGILSPSMPEAEAASLRARFVGCLRARAEIQVDESLTLPPNPFEVVAPIEEFRFQGEVVLPTADMRTAAAEAAKTRVRLCDALTSAELALQELYLERGYLEADVHIPWPAEPTAPVTVDVQVSAGRPHQIGTISFDQSAVPQARRLDTTELRKRVAGFVTKGQVASMSAMGEAGEEVTRAFTQAGLGPVEATVERKESKKSVRVDITYRVSNDAP